MIRKIKNFLFNPERLIYLSLRAAIIFLTGAIYTETIHLDDGEDNSQKKYRGQG